MAVTQLIVMAKAPVAGFAKTRLIPVLGADGAARLARRLLDETMKQARAAGLGEVELCCTPDTTHPAFAAQQRQGGVRLSVQGGGDLGARMDQAITRALVDVAQVILIGTDATQLDAAYLRSACNALAGSDAVLGPAVDGGYVLIGLRRALPRLFEQMPWSTDQVLAQTRVRLAESGLRWVELAPLHDVDEAGDLTHLPSGWL